jgi:hypothetical protein
MRISFLVFLMIAVLGACDDSGSSPAPIVFGVGGSDFVVDLGNGFELARLSGDEVEVAPVSGPSSGCMIKAKVVRIAWNSDNVFAVRHPLTRRADPPSQYLYPNPDEEAWWIIDVKSRKVIGPLDAEAFQSRTHDAEDLEWMTPREVRDWGERHGPENGTGRKTGQSVTITLIIEGARS